MTAAIWIRRLFVALLTAAAALSMGQSCAGPAPGPVPVASACGLNATFCVVVVGKSPFALTAADFDGDGDRDLVAANFGTDNVEVLLNDGSGALASAGKYKVGPSPASIASGDWDGDGDVDIAVTDSRGVSVLLNQGNATFSAAVTTVLDEDLNAFPVSVVAADLDADGDIDLACPAIGFSSDFAGSELVFANVDHVGILLNDGRGTFTVSQSVLIGNAFPRLGNIAAGDLNGDGLPDLVIDQSSGKATVLLNRGQAVFEVGGDLPLGENHLSSDVRIADVDGDGLKDVLVADIGDLFEVAPVGQVVWFRNLGGAAFGEAMRLQAGDSPTAIVVADFDGDGTADLAVANNLSDDLWLYFNQGGGVFGEPVVLTVGDGPTAVELADMDGDGSVDLSVAHMVSGAVGVYLNDSAGAFSDGN